MEKAVAMRQITVKFPNVVANDHVDFEVWEGEIHGLLGENGAGKTTLMNVLYGLYQPDDGEIYIRGRKIEKMTPQLAIDLGIGMVHQHFMLVSPFTVTQNIILGHKASKGFLNEKEAKKKIVKLSEKYGLKVDPDAKIWQLSAGERQRVEILKILYRGAKILILDEPTSVLTPLETKDLFRTLQTMTEEGHSVVFITHKLEEALSITQRLTTLRNGKVVSIVKTGETTKEKLAMGMIGREVLTPLIKTPYKGAKEIFRVERLNALKDNGLPALKNVTFNVREGEIFGIAGVAGNGQRELADAITGHRKATGGKVLFNGTDMTNHSTDEIRRQGVGYIPEDRINMGLIMDFTVSENAVLGSHHDNPFTIGRFQRLNYPVISEYTDKIVKDFGVKTAGINVPTRQLSGGNLQRLILARELSRGPKLLVACNPTLGLDVGATMYIRNKFLEERGEGKAILLISEDLDEVLSLSDRIAIMYEGEIMGILSSNEAKIEEIALMMMGSKKMQIT